MREEEKEENDTVNVKRRCVSSFSAEAFEIFSQGEIDLGEWWLFLGGLVG